MTMLCPNSMIGMNVRLWTVGKRNYTASEKVWALPNFIMRV